jgi:hypothetical protein
MRLGVLAVLVGALLVCFPASASAAIRFAGPGGTGVNPCDDPARPCSLFVAADQTGGARFGDEILVEPGNYSDTAGDLGPNSRILLQSGARVHGLAGGPRPVVRLDKRGLFGAFLVQEDSGVSHIEIENHANVTGIVVDGGFAEDLIVRSSTGVGDTVACSHFSGVLRSSVCIGDERGGTAVGSSLGTNRATEPRLRNVTAVSRGPKSHGINYELNGPAAGFEISAIAVIAVGTETDVSAESLRGADVKIDLSHSDYATTAALTDADGGIVSVTAAGSGTNIVEPALLAADGIHQLAGSPTVDRGAVDVFSLPFDIDGEQRTIGLAPDIGADEFDPVPTIILETTTLLACTPEELTTGGPVATCTVTVSNRSGGLNPPTGAVAFSSDGEGILSGAAGCVLVPVNLSRSSCDATYQPTRVGSGTHLLSAVYGGDAAHEGSEGSAPIEVRAPAVPPTPPAPAGPAGSGGSGGGGAGSRPEPRPAPDTHFGRRSRKQAPGGRVRIAFGSDQAGSRFECKLDRGAFKPCRSPYRRVVKPGRHRLQVRAVNSDGVSDPTPALYRWRVVPG